MTHAAQRERLALAGFALILIAGLAALLGTYWDDAWHTDYGRDDFFIPPHLVLYAGVAAMGGMATLWAVATWYRTRSVRAVWSMPGLRLAVLGVVATFMAAPIDEFWHVAFGRDAVVWSPPHMVGFAALFALATGFLLEVSRLPGRLGAGMTVAMAALLLGAVHVPVIEYESDVPQFAVLWYLPVLTIGTLLAFAIVETRRRVTWMITAAAVGYTAVRIGILGFLAALGHSLIFVPPIVLPAIVLDLTGRRGWTPAARATAYTAAVYVVYAPFLNLALGGVRLETTDVVLGSLIACAGAMAVLAAFRAPAPRPRPRHAVALLAALLLLPSNASAHDPGQGTVVGAADFSAVRDRGSVTIEVRVAPDSNRPCTDFEPRRMVARRAGVTLLAPLTAIAPCQFGGEIDLPGRGRWFIYAEMAMGQRAVEAWTPVIVSSEGGRSARRSDIYVPPANGGGFSLLQIVTGVVLYGVCLLFMAVAVGAARRSPFADPRAARAPARSAAPVAAIVGVVAWSVAAAPVSAQQPAQVESDDRDAPAVVTAAEAAPGLAERRRHLLIPRPVVYYTEETGWTGGVDLTHSYRTSADPGTRPALSHLSALYAQKGQLVVGAHTDVYTVENRYRFSGHAGYVYYPSSFYGIGRDLSMGAGEPYTSRTVSLAVGIRRRVGSGLFLGGGWSAADYQLLDRPPDGVLAGGTIAGGQGGLVTGLSLSAGLDTRDGILGSRAGSYSTVTVRAFDPILGGDFRFAQIGLDARQYLAFPRDQVLAVRAVATTSHGDAPFQVLPTMGGAALMRGYSPMLNRDRNLVAAQIEHRLPLWWRLGAVGFVGSGAVAPRLAELDRDAVRFSYGGGLRFAIAPRERLNLRMDMGLGREGSTLHIGVGEAF
jgi:hypothetical protein